MCVTETSVIACTISEILAQIDDEGPNLTFPTLKMTFQIFQQIPSLDS